MLLAVFAGFIAALLWAVTGSKLKSWVGFPASLVPVVLFIYFLSLLPVVSQQGGYTITFPWVPSLGVDLSFRVDGLALLFALLITGIGSLVFIYTIAYLKSYKNLHTFYAYLSMFMGAMLGLVLSDNLISLFIFWELTSISSFFLIGFKNEDAASRRSAMIALSITGFGGLALLAGALVMGSVTGTYSVQEILASGIDLPNEAFYGLIVVLFFGAAFTKSAQFPFHFWLPGAMKAPTPVSTYLHSATMVKAGVYLLLRMSPILDGHAYWHTTLMVAGGITMLYAAFHTLFRTDMKGILAYSTISALGVMVFLTGIGTHEALLAVVVFILVHALYKAALFLVTGGVDYATGSRDITKLAGLGRLMPALAIAGFVAALSNAGIPPSMGFVGKDLIYEATLHAKSWQTVLTAAAITTNILLLVAGFFVGLKPFAGTLQKEVEVVATPGVLIWAPPLLLGVLSLVFGIAPGLLQEVLIFPILKALAVDTQGMEIKMWHGFNLVLLLSAITIGVGLLLYYFYKPSYSREKAISRYENLSPEQIGVKLSYWLYALAKSITSFFQSGYLRRYVRVIVLFLTILVGTQLIGNLSYPDILSILLELTVYEVVVVAIILLAILYTVRTSSRLGAVAGMGVVGYSICLLFVFYSAPDLAMTQFTIDTLTVILFVLVLYKLPRYVRYSNKMDKFRDWVVALSFGGTISMVALAIVANPGEKQVGAYYGENAYTLAKGKNIVNVILVDFRGIDTLVEITVLVIAALGVFGLMKLRIKDK